MENQITVLENIFLFILGGNSFFTILNPSTNNRFTYRIVKKDFDDGRSLHFVSVLTGTDNETSYTYLGTIFNNSRYFHGKKSSISKDAMSAKAFRWFYMQLCIGESLGPIEFFHEGRCARCGRKLTTPESIATGFGSVCIEKVAA